MRPGTSFLIILAGLSLSSLILLFFPGFGPVWIGSAAILVLIAVVDMSAGLCRRRSGPGVVISRDEIDIFTVDSPVNISIEIKSRGVPVPRFLQIYEELPAEIEADPYPVIIGRKDWTQDKLHKVDVTWTAKRRGNWHSPGMRVEYPSPLGLFRMLNYAANPVEMRVLPDIRSDHSGLFDPFEAMRNLPGDITVRKRGEGTEFRELRDYIPGDSVRHIDWRATSRRSSPVVRTFQEERDQQVLIILDGGYRLHQKEGTGLQFDHALRAALRLSAVALDYRDSVGLYAYGREDRWIPPAKGRSQYWNLMKGIYDYESAAVATSPATALEKVLTWLKRRTFLIFITNLREEDGEIVSWMLPLVRGRHLMMAVTLREEGAAGPHGVANLDDALEYGAAAMYRDQRMRLRRYWEKQGILTLDSRPGELSSRIINRYLTLKGAGIL